MSTISRREFLKYAGATAGVAAAAGSGLTYFASRASNAAQGPLSGRPVLAGDFGGRMQLTEQMQGILDELAARKDLHHATLTVESGDGAFQWSGAAGCANPKGDPMLASTPYFIASIDKLYVAAAIMRLRERGLIGLDTSIAEYLPQPLVSGIHRLDGVDRSSAITVHHLLSHTSGLADYLEDSPKGGSSLVERVVSGGDIDWDLGQGMELLRQDLTPHFVPQPAASPKPKVRYCDTNYQLLIAIVESVEGRTLDGVLDEMLFTPFGMNHTHLEGLSKPKNSTATAPASLWFGDEAISLPRFLKALRSVYSTGEDQIRSARAILGGEVFDDPATVASMRRWNAMPFPTDPAAARAPGWPVKYGYGLMHFQLPRVLTRMRQLPAVLGHTGSTGSWLFHCPETDIYLAGTVDQGTAGAVPYRLMPKLLRVLSG